MIIAVGGIPTRVEQRGSGAPVLILHGWGANLELMRTAADAVAGMGMRAVSFDFPGFGETPEPPAVWGVPEYASFTRALMRQLGLEGCDVVCHSFGGRVALYLAGEDTGLFRRLVLVDAAGIRPKRGPRWYVRTYAYKLGKRLARIKWLDRALHLNERQKSAGSADYRALQSDVMRGVFVKTVNLDLTNRLPKIRNPALLVWGSADDMTPLWMGRLMEKRIPNAGLAVFEGAGHFSYAEQPARFAAVLRAFFFPGQ